MGAGQVVRDMACCTSIRDNSIESARMIGAFIWGGETTRPRWPWAPPPRLEWIMDAALALTSFLNELVDCFEGRNV